MKTIIDFREMEEKVKEYVNIAIDLNEDDSYNYSHFYNLYLYDDFFQVTIGALRFLRSKCTGITRYCPDSSGEGNDAIYQLEFKKGRIASITVKTKTMNLVFTVDNFEYACPLDLRITLDINGGEETKMDIMDAYKEYVKAAICEMLVFHVNTEREEC